jgi:hypothetical protein
VTAGDSVADALQGEVHTGPGVPQPLKPVAEFVHDQERDVLIGLISAAQAGVEGAGYVQDLFRKSAGAEKDDQRRNYTSLQSPR